ncbi:50S ribosomal protein L10 [Elusimicrobiota bacterium]
MCLGESYGKKEKELLVEKLTDKIKKNNNIVFTEYQGLTVSEISDLRSQLRACKCEYKVVKNTLSKIALKNAGLESFANYFDGPTAIAIENGDFVASAKVLAKFAKEHDKLKIKAGISDKKELSVENIKILSQLPSREVLIAKLLNVMQAPISGMVNVLQGTIRNFVYVLEAIKQKK